VTWSNPLRGITLQLSRGESLRDVQKVLGNSIDGLPVFAACVLWSADTTSDAFDATVIDGVNIVAGPRLSEWLKGLETSSVTDRQIAAVWQKLSNFVQECEAGPGQKGVHYRPTFRRLVLRWTLAMVSGFVIALSTPIAVNRLTDSWVADFAGIIFVLAAGLFARRAERWRSFGTGLLIGDIVSVATLLNAVVRAKGGG
jgi:hypothetical protein